MFSKRLKVIFSIFTMSEFVEQRSAIKFYLRNEISVAATFRMLQKAFGDLTMSQKNLYKWFKDFKEGRERVDDLERPGRPSTSTDGQNTNQIKELVHKNRLLTIRDLADTIGISRGSSWPFRQKLNAYRPRTTRFAWFGSVWLLAIPQTQKTTSRTLFWHDCRDTNWIEEGFEGNSGNRI